MASSSGGQAPMDVDGDEGEARRERVSFVPHVNTLFKSGK
jgi:hypothetical protein